MGSACAIVLFYNLHLRSHIEYNNHVRTRVLEETRAFSQGRCFSVSFLGRDADRAGAVCFCVVSVNLRGVVSIVWGCHGIKTAWRWSGWGRCRVFCSSSFSLGRCLFFVVRRVRCVADRRGAARVLLFFFSCAPGVLPSVRLSSVRLAVMLSRCPVVRLSLALPFVALALLLFWSSVILSYIVHKYAAFRHCKHLCILVNMTAKHNNV